MNLEKHGLDNSAVISWDSRPKRQRKGPPLTYWEEFVATDEWYLNELLADVGEDELQAAIHDEDFSDESGDEGPDEDDDDASYSESCAEEDESDDDDEGGDSLDESSSVCSRGSSTNTTYADEACEGD